MTENVRAGVVLAGAGILVFMGWWSGLFAELIEQATDRVRRAPSVLAKKGAAVQRLPASSTFEPVQPVYPTTGAIQ